MTATTPVTEESRGTRTPAPPLRRNRAFTLLWTGSAISALGSSVSAFAYPLLVLMMTGSASAAGLVTFLATLPNILLQLPAGVLVDRFDRKRIMVVCDIGRALGLGSIAVALLLGEFSLPHIAVVAFVEGALSVPHRLCSSAAIPNVVEEEHLTTAFARNETRDRAAHLLGNPIGGALMGIGRGIPFLFDALSYVVSVVSLLFIRKPFQRGRSAESERPEPRGGMFDDVKQGVAWLFKQPFIRTTTLLVGGSNFLFQALSLAVVAKLAGSGTSPAVIGWVLSAAGIGGTAGALLAPRFNRLLTLRALVIAANWGWAALIPVVALVDDPVALGAVLALIVFIGPVWNVGVDVYRLSVTPDELQGRVSAAAVLVEFGTIPLGALLGGYLIDQLSSDTTVLVLGGCMVVLAGLAAVSRSLRRTTS
ncbi:hypothetical protein ALI144C_07570 [Actinosynnema sp. ALI-1.44]|uniref:MFS transporter n=1 Tax=Actinosynnema sp. ALI-1.44 TaxID=1933779 RepID=UPI00097C1EBB|nr:MFS transporter [Actinosynnema sp. ALI-1.44]ONI88285.1 hypothetical protein ALI144C_07570 [Actinosynnema sp. ALI-1.44]